MRQFFGSILGFITVLCIIALAVLFSSTGQVSAVQPTHTPQPIFHNFDLGPGNQLECHETHNPHDIPGPCPAAPAPTDTPVPPTATQIPPTATEVPPTATEVPPTATDVPPTEIAPTDVLPTDIVPTDVNPTDVAPTGTPGCEGDCQTPEVTPTPQQGAGVSSSIDNPGQGRCPDAYDKGDEKYINRDVKGKARCWNGRNFDPERNDHGTLTGH